MNLLDVFKSTTLKFKSEDIRDIMSAIPTEKSGTVKSWFADKKGKQVLVLSIDVDENMEVKSAWSPGIREVDSIRSTYATIEGSRIDFKGTVLASHKNYVIFSHPWGDRTKVFGYRVF